jgi:hypothetical protein
MSEYTPSQGDVELGYVERAESVSGTPHFAAGLEFDRWLAEHDAEVAKTEREEWAQFFDRRSATVGVSPMTDEIVADFLRAPRPWGLEQGEGR